MKPKYEILWTCSECFGTNVVVKAWIDPNTDIAEDWALCDRYSDTWCHDCGEHTDFFHEILVPIDYEV